MKTDYLTTDDVHNRGWTVWPVAQFMPVPDQTGQTRFGKTVKRSAGNPPVRVVKEAWAGSGITNSLPMRAELAELEAERERRKTKKAPGFPGAFELRR